MRLSLLTKIRFRERTNHISEYKHSKIRIFRTARVFVMVFAVANLL